MRAFLCGCSQRRDALPAFPPSFGPSLLPPLLPSSLRSILPPLPISPRSLPLALPPPPRRILSASLLSLQTFKPFPTRFFPSYTLLLRILCPAPLSLSLFWCAFCLFPIFLGKPAAAEEEAGGADVVDRAAGQRESVGHQLRVELAQREPRSKGGHVCRLGDGERAQLLHVDEHAARAARVVVRAMATGARARLHAAVARAPHGRLHVARRRGAHDGGGRRDGVCAPVLAVALVGVGGIVGEGDGGNAAAQALAQLVPRTGRAREIGGRRHG
eukprot:4133140-Pleurochrysis_carterae.AAC.1